MIFPEPLPFRSEYGCVGLRDKDVSPWYILYTDDIVLCGTRGETVENRLEEWRRGMEDVG